MFPLLTEQLLWRSGLTTVVMLMAVFMNPVMTAVLFLVASVCGEDYSADGLSYPVYLLHAYRDLKDHNI